MFCMSTVELFLLLFFIVPQKISERLMMKDAAPQSVAVARPNNWMNGEPIVKWVQHFIKFSKPTAQKPVLLNLDDHCSHKELAVTNFAKKNHIPSTPLHDTQISAFK